MMNEFNPDGKDIRFIDSIIEICFASRMAERFRYTTPMIQ